MIKTRISVIVGVALALSAWSHEIAGIRLPHSVKVSDDLTMQLYGAGLLKYKVVFKGYVLGLYLPKRARDPMADTPKQLTFHYFWDIEARAFADKAEELLKESLGAREFREMQPKMLAFHKLYRDVKEDDRYHLRYLPEIGMQLFHNDKHLGTVEGAEFAKAYFGIWLGDDPMDKDLKKAVLTKIRKG